MAVFVDIKNWNPPTLTEDEYAELRKTMSDEEVCRFMNQKKKEQTCIG